RRLDVGDEGLIMLVPGSDECVHGSLRTRLSFSSRTPKALLPEHRTSNTEHRTSKAAASHAGLGVGCWALDVGCWAFDVFLLVGCGSAALGRRRIFRSASANG